VGVISTTGVGDVTGGGEDGGVGVGVPGGAGGPNRGQSATVGVMK